MSLRDPKDVAKEIIDAGQDYRLMEARDYVLGRAAGFIRADRAAVIAEAKRVLGEVLAMPSAWPYRREVLDALDDILKET